MGRKENAERIRAEQSKYKEELIYKNMIDSAQTYYELNKHKWLGEDGYNNKPQYKEYQKKYYEDNKNKWVEYRERDSFNCTYLFVDVYGNVIRIGSTNCLRNRVVQYLNANVFKNWGIWKWFNLMKLDKILYIEVDTREKAYALESVLIDKYEPILNQNRPDCNYWDKYIDKLGDLTNIEELFMEYDISRYKNVYQDLL